MFFFQRVALIIISNSYVIGKCFRSLVPVFKPGFLSYHLLSPGIPGHLVGQKTRQDYEPCRTGLMTPVLDGFSSTSIITKIIKTGQKQDI